MKTILLATSLMLFAFPAANAQPCEDGTRWASSVKSWVEIEVKERMPGGAMLGSSWVEKYVHRMGDAMAVALLHAYSDEELLQQDRLIRILPYLEEAFKYRRLITCNENTRPRVTLLLLRSLQERTRDDTLKKQIGALEEQLAKAR